MTISVATDVFVLGQSPKALNQALVLLLGVPLQPPNSSMTGTCLAEDGRTSPRRIDRRTVPVVLSKNN